MEKQVYLNTYAAQALITPQVYPETPLFKKQADRQQVRTGAWSGALFRAMMKTEEGRELFREGVRR